MICAVHQPNFVPYLGFFNKMKNSDVFVYYDSVQYSKNDFHNRNKIKSSSGPIWITVPVSVSLGQSIRDVKIASSSFKNKHLRSIETNYKKSLNFDFIFDNLKNIYSRDHEYLLDLNMDLLSFVTELIMPEKKILLSSQLNLDKNKKSTEALLEILDVVGADTYISGSGAHNYLDEKLFEKAEKKLIWQDFKHPSYDQLWGNFSPNLSVLDVMFNVKVDDIYDMI